MKNYLYLIIYIPLFLLLNSCTEQIEIDLNSSDPQIVVQGSVATDGKPSVIKLTESVNFDDSNNFPEVQNAIVELSDNLGNTEILTEISPGNYSTDQLTGKIGRTYYLQIQKDDKLLTAESKIPDRVNFDQLKVKKSDGTGGGPGGFGSTTNYNVIVYYADPPEENNYYRFVEFVNGERQEGYIFDDRLTDGSNAERALVRFNRNLDKGDTLQVVMQCIDKNIYEYFNSFGNLMGGPANSSTPANPYTNIEGGVLGYFSAHTYEVKEFVVP